MAKRAFDLIVAGVGLLLVSPLLIAVAVVIKLSSPGPVLYSQLRVGRHGRHFRIYKFRSMVINADRLGSSVTTGADRRITPIGRILRRTKLDELPQLFNVLRGEMSLVGPRPDVPEIVDLYTPELRRILEVRPGITSVATVHLRDEELLLTGVTDPDRFYIDVLVPAKVRLAMQHVDNPSLLYDCVVLAQTAWALTGGRLIPLPKHPILEQVRSSVDLSNHAGEPV
jgi:lipopolysaccharide/colanic/teichoic acid biosynthesis glycosyltransferase